ncbi:MAG: dephospho-CoA kinase [Halanaerobiales bacterium]|nr:dephospho-CoA kinase [Halanaerobiales bacterium]
MIIGLTGGIATGKSTVSKILKDLNIKVIDADKIAHNVLEYEDVKKEIKETFGNKVLNENGEIDRKKLGKIVFKENQKLKKLESITHPKILEIIDNKLKESKSELIVLDAPLLFESSLDGKVDEIWVVYASEETQISRLRSRDNLNKKEALDRINSQMDIDTKVNKADIVINNEGTIEALEKKVKKLIQNRS